MKTGSRIRCAWALIVAALAMLSALGSLARAGLVGHWKFDGDLTDETANSNDGAAGGDASAGTNDGKIGGAVSFDGAGDSVSISNVESRVGETMSISVWEYTTTASGTEGYLYCFGEPPFGAGEMFLRRYSGGTRLNGGMNYTEVEGGDRAEFGSPAVARDQWNQHLITIDSTGTNGVTGTWFINGVSNRTAYGSGNMSDAMTYPLVLGNNLSLVRDFDGRLDDLQIYDELLDADASAFLFNNPGYTFSPLPRGTVFVVR